MNESMNFGNIGFSDSLNNNSVDKNYTPKH